jgi:hypothetical protein
MRELGFHVVRFFLLTEDFLPEPTQVAATSSDSWSKSHASHARSAWRRSRR